MTKNKKIAILIVAYNAAKTISHVLDRIPESVKEMVEEKNRFISDASHELRTPLTALKSSFEVDLRDENLSIDNAKKTMSAGIEDVNNLQHLSDSLLQLSQYEKSGTYSNFEKVGRAPGGTFWFGCQITR